MKVTRKLGTELSSLTAAPGDMDKDEMPASLYLSHLPKEIDGMPDKGDFRAHIRGKVRRHTTTTQDGKTHHGYDLDVHHVECDGKKPEKKRKSDKEELDEAFAKHFGKKDEK